jgi:diguanylate cyclase
MKTTGMKASFERARDALIFLERHQLDPSAANYDFALYYVTNPASKLAREVNEQTVGGLRLTSDAMLKLAERHLPQGSGAALDRREQTVARQAEELGSLTSDAHDLTEALGRGVGEMVKQSDEWPKGTGDLLTRLSDAERELAELRNEFLVLRNAIGIPGQRRADTDGDALTNSLSRGEALQILERIANESSTYLLLMFSIDDLVGINNRYGRQVGDNVLNAFAATLQQTFPGEELIRWNGNEFIILATDLVKTSARLLIEDALAALKARRLKLRGTGEWIGTITASAGIAVSQGEEPEVVLERARENALSAAAQGGDRFQG